ncbi:MAG: cyclase family protein [Phycisphaerales bacterium JB043]
MARSIHDITPLVSPSLAVFPGDTPFSSKHLLHLDKGDPVTLSTTTSTVHLGAHIDGPNHYDQNADGVDTIPLDRCVGPCDVITVSTHPDARFAIDELAHEPTHPRVLLRTSTYRDPNTWADSFAAPAPECVDALADLGVQLLGIDTPSVDSATSKGLPSHARCAARNITILEGIVLTDIPDGVYELVALPLRLEGLDASPVRAVLRELG